MKTVFFFRKITLFCFVVITTSCSIGKKNPSSSATTNSSDANTNFTNAEAPPANINTEIKQVTPPKQILGTVDITSAQLSSYDKTNCTFDLSNPQTPSLFCWGNGDLWLNDNSNSRSFSKTFNGIPKDPISISLGLDFGCILTKNNLLSCFGDSLSKLRDDVKSNSDLLNIQDPYPNLAYDLNLGGNHTCVILKNGSIECFGQGSFGQLGNGSLKNSATPIPITDSLQLDVDKVIGGSSHTFLLTKKNTVYCFGFNNDGRCGFGKDLTNISRPTLLESTIKFKQVAAFDNHSCLLTVIGDVYCMGKNDMGQLGDASTFLKNTPVLATQFLTSNIRNLPSSSNSSAYFTCVITATGSVRCLGLNTYGQIGNGDNIRNNPVNDTKRVTTASEVLDFNQTPLNDVVDIVQGGQFACALKKDNSVWCWGDNSYGQLGNGTKVSSSLAQRVELNDDAIQLSAGAFTVCALIQDNSVKCWGGNLATENLDPMLIPTSIEGLKGNAKSISLGASHACALTLNNLIKCWGMNTSFQLGEQDTTIKRISADRYLPYYGGIDQMTKVASGKSHVCLLTNGAAKCFGQNNKGQLGLNSTINSSVPQYVRGVEGRVVDIFAGDDFSCFLNHFGEISCAGDNTYGQTLNSSNRPFYPQVLSDLKNIVIIGGGPRHLCAVDNEQRLFCWGSLARNETANFNTSFNTPVPITKPFTQSIKSIVGGMSHTCLLTSNQQIYCFGNNFFGQLGNGTYKNSNTPVLVKFPESLKEFTVTNLSAGELHTCATFSNDEIYCWGSNDSGQVNFKSSIFGKISDKEKNKGKNSSESSTTYFTDEKFNLPQKVVGKK